MSDTREHLHELIDQLPPSQLPAVAGLLEAMLEDPESEPVTEADVQRFLEAQASFAAGEKGTPMEEVLAELGLKVSDFPLSK